MLLPTRSVGLQPDENSTTKSKRVKSEMECNSGRSEGSHDRSEGSRSKRKHSDPAAPHVKNGGQLYSVGNEKSALMTTAARRATTQAQLFSSHCSSAQSHATCDVGTRLQHQASHPEHGYTCRRVSMGNMRMPMQCDVSPAAQEFACAAGKLLARRARAPAPKR